MSAAEEEARAVEYRRKMQAREDNRAAAEARLAGSPSALAGLRERMAGALRWAGWDPVRKVEGDVAGQDYD